MWAAHLLNGDSRKSELEEALIRPPPRWSKHPAFRHREQDLWIIVADAVHAGADGTPLEGPVMGFSHQLEQRWERRPRVEPVAEPTGIDDRRLAVVKVLKPWGGHRGNDGEGLQR